jgi:hypothetical protein
VVARQGDAQVVWRRRGPDENLAFLCRKLHFCSTKVEDFMLIG